MATASPTPMPAVGPIRRTSQRQALRRPPSRQMVISRSESQAVVLTSPRNQYHDDSSEDEIPVPMKLSALTKALLNDGEPPAAMTKPSSPPITRRRTSALNNGSTASGAAPQDRRGLRSTSAQPTDDRDVKAANAGQSQETSPVRKRVVRLGSNPHSSLSQIAPSKRRSTSMSRPAPQRSSAPPPPPPPSGRTGYHEKPAEEEQEDQRDTRQQVNTPSQGAERVVRIVTGSSATRNRVGSAGPSSASGQSNHDRSAADRSHLEAEYNKDDVPDIVPHSSGNNGSASRYQSTRSRPDEINLQSSMRVKRVGKLSGSFLSGPARRGRRRQSEEDGEVNADGEQLAARRLEADQRGADEAPESSVYHEVNQFNAGSPIGGSGSWAGHAGQGPELEILDLGSSRRSSRGVQPEVRRDDHVTVPEEMLPRRIEMPSTHDQENEYPMTFKRPTKVAASHGLDKPVHRPMSIVNLANVKLASPERKPLAAISANTPHRAAPPPPPKMSVLEAATSAAGAATATQAKQRRNVLRVNGKCYTRLDCLGRGGSAKVYRVTADNGKMFALKRVALENADENTIKGYKGEIDLLTKLKDVDRVIDLYDHEMNTEKQVLTLLMEMGELDLNKLLTSRQNPELAKFDPVFVRFYWKEMLECLQSVHQYEIVHSDLKPANFVLVQGRLKLIDFGIANAIQTDETVNVHRETQVGTPNYMSPESLLDANRGRLQGGPRLVKLGKPSDVWSLGCILYQMVYGVPPFGHIANPIQRCQTIINWNHTIEFPSRAMGGVPVPPSLLRTMKRCLNRDQHIRPTCEELLHATDPFLYPAELSDKSLPIDEDLLGRIIQSVVTRCRERMPTEAESASAWPQAYWTSIRKAMAGRI